MSGDLFGAPVATTSAELTEREKWNARAPDDFDLIAHELYGVPSTMRWLEVETLGDLKTPRALASFRVLMVEAPDAVLKSGPRKGRINWKKRDRSLDREVVCSFARYDEWRAARAVKP